MKSINKYILSFLIVVLSIGIGSAQSVPVPDILHLQFDNQSSLGESTTLAVDIINNHDGVISNMDDYTIGKVGNASDLTGSTPSFITIADHDALSQDIVFNDDDSAHTFAFSIKCDDYENILIFEKEDEYKLETVDNKLVYTSHDSLWGGDWSKYSSLDLSQFNGGEYIHIVLTGEFPSGITKIYVNNVNTRSGYHPKPITYEGMHNDPYDLIIGNASANHNMCIDEFQYWTVGLDERDVEWLYYSQYDGVPSKMPSVWELIRDVVSNLGAIVNLIVLFIVVSVVMCVGSYVKSIINIK